MDKSLFCNIKAMKLIHLFSVLLGLALLSNSTGFSQNIQINWNGERDYLTEQGTIVKSLSFDNACFNSKTLLPFFVQQYADKQLLSVIIDQPIYQRLNGDDSVLIQNAILTDKIQSSIEVGYAAGSPVSFVKITPFLKRDGQIYKLMSATLKPTYSTTLITKVANNTLSVARTSASITNSVLNTGEWFKIGVLKNGIYKLDAGFLQAIGIPSTVNPRKIQVFGNGGGTLPQKNSENKYDDLVENAIYFKGEEDSTLNSQDYILAYLQGPDNIIADTLAKRFKHLNNVYSDSAFYFITYNQNLGKRVNQRSSLPDATDTISTFDDFFYHENDLVSISKSGREWFGESFEFNTSQTFTENVKGIVNGSSIKLTASVMAKATLGTSFVASINNDKTNIFLSAIQTSGFVNTIADENIGNLTSISNGNENISLKFDFVKGSATTALGYLNYYYLNVSRELRLYDSHTFFSSFASLKNSTSKFIVKDVNTNSLIWDITTFHSPVAQNFDLINNKGVFVANTNKWTKWVVLNENGNFSTPIFVKKITNQNLHALATPQLLIVTHGAFESAAQKLASFRRTHDNLAVEVVTLDKVYNEFSSGAQDVSAIKNLARMFYKRKDGIFKSLLLFGDCSYDYKNRVNNNSNYVPVYESYETLTQTNSFSSDDYFGLLDDNEGEWNESFGLTELMDIGIGRLPVSNLNDANKLVDKLINYNGNSEVYGKWKNSLTFLSDDGDGNSHMLDAESCINQIEANYKQFNFNKLYLNAFPQEATPVGQTSVALVNALNQSVANGTFLVNYTGHGREIGLTSENVVTLEQIKNWTNLNKLFFMVTATCEFGRYDDPTLESGAEVALLNPLGGAVGCLTSTRPVYQSTNGLLNRELFRHIFNAKDGQYPTLGEITRNTKNGSVSTVYNRNYALLGDPSMTLEYPKNKIKITQLNGDTIGAGSDTVKALEKTSFSGEIIDYSGAKLTDFNGDVFITFFDKSSPSVTRGDQGDRIISFNEQKNIIFQGKATVTTGEFNITFVVPKDISYNVDKGKISMYAMSSSLATDAAGSELSVKIGGSSPGITPDDKVPNIRLFMNDTSFVSGGITNKNPNFIAYLEDENGINVALTGIGHEIVATLNNDNANQIVLNEYYVTLKDSYQKGTIVYPFKNLPNGRNTLTLRAWDTHNNSNQASIEFVVSDNSALVIEDILNYASTDGEFVNFSFEHNRAGEDLDIQVKIFNLNGHLAKELSANVPESSTVVSGLQWKTNYSDGSQLSSSMFVYKITVRSKLDGSTAYATEKLVFLK